MVCTSSEGTSVIRSDAVIVAQDERAVIIQHDARELPLEDASVDLIVTSPPYFALRSYRDGCATCGGVAGTLRPRDGSTSTLTSPQYTHKMYDMAQEDCTDCDGTGTGHYDGQLGSEDTPAEFIANLIDCTREWVRVLKPSGSMFVNLGDKFAGPSNQGNRWRTLETSYGTERPSRQRRTEETGERGYVPATSIPTKSRMLLPHRYAIACIDQLGLIVRMDMVWSKPNGLPESVTDRVRASHEYWFHITKEPRYFSGLDEIREPYLLDERASAAAFGSTNARAEAGDFNSGPLRSMVDGGQLVSRDTFTNPLGRTPGSVWEIATEPLLIPNEIREARQLPDHFAAFPQEWPRRLIAGFAPTGICVACDEPRRAVVRPDWSAVPHVMEPGRVGPELTPERVAKWAADFGRWCADNGISARDLDNACGTNGMGGHWTTTASQPAVPTPEHWVTIATTFAAPDEFAALVGETKPRPVVATSGYGAPEHGRTGLGGDIGHPTKTITGYECACPPIGDDAPTRPAVVLDPFGGTGTVAGVARTLGRYGISNDLSSDYCRLAAWRVFESGHFVKSEQRTWRDRQGTML